MDRAFHQKRASTLLTVLLTIVVLSLVIGTFYRNLIPRYRSIHQSASWQDALLGAEGGINYALGALNDFATSGGDPDGYDWTANGWSSSDPKYTVNGERTLASASLPELGGKNNVRVTRLAVDVFTRTDAVPHHPWFRIRSTARADLPDRFISADKRDSALRRMNLSSKKAGAPDPHVQRTVEVIVKPRFYFSNAITTEDFLSLGNSNNWRVDSFDSSDPNKSDPGTAAGGVYPSSASKRQSNGNVASNMTQPDWIPYGPLIDANGAVVEGDVRTNGGDDPNTTAHENVSESSGIDPDRIFDDFDRDLPLVPKPTWTSNVQTVTSSTTSFSTGTATTPKRYIVNGNLGSFSVIDPNASSSGGSSGGGNGNGNGNGGGKKNGSGSETPTTTGAGSTPVTGYVEIVVNGNLDVGSGNSAKIVIPPSVFATIYVDGNIEMGNGIINSDTASSRVATHLMIFGVSTSASPTYRASGNAVQTLAFYGPQYGITLNGTVETYGAMVGKSFDIKGGGNGSFHYDEALGKGGPITGWDIASYFDDSRAPVAK